MSDTNEIKVSKKEWNGAYVPKHTAKLVKAAIENSTAPFIPNNGQVSTPLLFNANTGLMLDAKDMIPVLLTKIEKGYQSNAVGTFGTMQKVGTSVKKDEKGVYYNFKAQDGEFHHSAYFFGEQTDHPDRFAKFANDALAQKQNLRDATIKAFKPDAVDYLAAYIAACKSGAKFEAAPEIAEKFKANMLAVADNELARTAAEKNKDIPGMTEVLTNAGKKANEIVESMEKKRGIGQQKSQENAQEFKPKQNKRKPRDVAMSH